MMHPRKAVLNAVITIVCVLGMQGYSRSQSVSTPVSNPEIRSAPIPPEKTEEGKADAGGIVEGVVRYRPDPGRIWRYSRYYVREPSDGGLAEAVVVLGGAVPTGSVRDVPARTNTVDQVDFQFVPETLAIRAGDAVKFLNSDESIHNVMTSDGDEPFNVNMVKDGEFVHTFRQAGGVEKPIRLGCVFHGGMRAWVYIFDHPWFQVTGKDGRFRLESVPPGDYTIEMIHPAGKLQSSRRIAVKPRETTALVIEVSPDDVLVPKQTAAD